MMNAEEERRNGQIVVQRQCATGKYRAARRERGSRLSPVSFPAVMFFFN